MPKVGDTATVCKLVNLTDIHAVAAVSRDCNPMHLNPAFARRTRFRRRIAHGILAVGLASAAAHKISGPATPAEAETRFLKPVYPGDKLTATARVTVVDPNKGTLTLCTSVCNQHGQEVLSGKTVAPYHLPGGERRARRLHRDESFQHRASKKLPRPKPMPAVNASASMEKTVTDSDLKALRQVLPGVDAGEFIPVGLVSAVLGNVLPGPGTIYLGNKLSVRKRVGLGDRITATARVTSVRADKPIIKLSTQVIDQNGATILEGETVTLFEPISR